MEKLPFLERQHISLPQPRVLGWTQNVLDLRGVARCRDGEHAVGHQLRARPGQEGLGDDPQRSHV